MVLPRVNKLNSIFSPKQPQPATGANASGAHVGARGGLGHEFFGLFGAVSWQDIEYYVNLRNMFWVV